MIMRVVMGRRRRRRRDDLKGSWSASSDFLLHVVQILLAEVIRDVVFSC